MNLTFSQTSLTSSLQNKSFYQSKQNISNKFNHQSKKFIQILIQEIQFSVKKFLFKIINSLLALIFIDEAMPSLHQPDAHAYAFDQLAHLLLLEAAR